MVAALTYCVRYADDIKLLSPSAFTLEVLHGKVSSMFSVLSLKTNPLKSVYIMFKRRPIFVIPGKIRVKGYCLNRFDEIKYLEPILMSTFNDETLVLRCSETAQCSLSQVQSPEYVNDKTFVCVVLWFF